MSILTFVSLLVNRHLSTLSPIGTGGGCGINLFFLLGAYCMRFGWVVIDLLGDGVSILLDI